MAKQRIDAIIIQKIATLAEWNNIGRVPEKGEFMLIQNTASQPVNLKIGDGNRAFTALPNFIQYDQAAYVAPSGNTLPAPQNGVGYSLLTEGSYNSGALVVPTGNIGIADYIGNAWVVRNMALPTSALADQTGESTTIAATQRLVTSIDNKTIINKNTSVPIKVGKNKFNKNGDNLDDFYLSPTGALVPDATRYMSHYIPVTNVNYFLRYDSIGGTRIIFYDADLNIVGNTQNRSFTPTSGVSYIRFPDLKTNKSVQQLEIGSAFTSYEEFTDLSQSVKTVDIVDGAITESKIASGSVSNSKISNLAVSPEKTNFFEQVPGSNLFNPNDPEFVDGFILSNITGIPTNANSGWATTGFIAVEDILPFYLGNNGIRINARFAHSYNDQKVRIRGGEDAGRQFFTVDSNDKYVRFSFNKSDTRFQVNQGSIKPYEPYSLGYLIKKKFIPKQDGLDILKKSIDSVRGQNASTRNIPNAVANTNYQITDFPINMKKGFCYSGEGFFTTFGGAIIGNGYMSFSGLYFEVNSTNILMKRFGSSEQILETIAHGLTIESFVKISVSVGNDGKPLVVIFSKNGQFKTKFTTYFDYNGTPFFRSINNAMTDVKFSFGGLDFMKSIWAFGDSYFGTINPDRWMGVMKDIGYFNLLVNGLSGIASPAARQDFEKSLLHGTPKYLFWCLGMNDGDPNVWISNIEIVKAICAENNIELILATIPTVPTRSKEIISDYVRNSGYRFVDFYKAVGTNSSGAWYDGYLGPDGVHPTVLGAQALANQVLIDFPELMQYGKI